MIYIHLIAGLVLLLGGGELLVRGAVRLAAAIGLSPLVIGLTVVGFGTSTPELVTSIEAALSGTPGIAIGNIVGSNIANILLILGTAALIFPIAVGSAALRRDGTIMLGAAVLFAVLSALMPLGRLLGAGFVVVLLAYVVIIVRVELRANARPGALFDKALALEEADPGLSSGADSKGGLLLAAGFCIAGLALLISGGSLLVDGAVSLASQMGVSDTIIGLTIVAVGTSLPELITSVIAALRRQADVAFGNIVGSNIYNILGIGGVTALMAPLTVPARIVSFDNIAMVLASAIVLFFAFTGRRIRRWEGGVLLAGYCLYVYLIWP